jgi:hypothetical protein
MTVISPLCNSMMDRQIDRPIPSPSAFVEKGVKHLLQVLGSDALPCIYDGNADRAGHHGLRLNGQTEGAAQSVGRRLQPSGNEIDEDLLELDFSQEIELALRSVRRSQIERFAESH